MQRIVALSVVALVKIAYLDHKDPKNKIEILDLTVFTNPDQQVEGPDYICKYCDVKMHKAPLDLVDKTNSDNIAVKQGQHYCPKCWKVIDPLSQESQDQIAKTQENYGMPTKTSMSDNQHFIMSTNTTASLTTSKKRRRSKVGPDYDRAYNEM